MLVTLPVPRCCCLHWAIRPSIIPGPGEPSMAHQTDEYCLLSRLAEAEQLYVEIIKDWMD